MENEIIASIRKAFSTRGAPEFTIPKELGLEQENCLYYVGKPWQDAIGDLLYDLQCLWAFDDSVAAYYLPAYAIEVLQNGITRSNEFFVRFLPLLYPGSDLAIRVLETTTGEQRRAIRDWLTWIHDSTAEFADERDANLSALEEALGKTRAD